MEARKFFILGLDGATFDIIDRMIPEGRLPAFARMKEEGVFGRLESVANQRSAAAWTSFQTGTKPCKHGIFEFYDTIPETYNLEFVHAGSRVGQSIWNILSGKGRKVGVINVPMSYPAERVDGFLIAGIDCPSVRSKGFTWPRELAGELRRMAGPYMIEPGLTGAMVGGRVREAVDMIGIDLDQKMNTARHLMKTRPWDVFVVVLRSLDAVQHSFWKYMDSLHPDHDRRKAEEFGGVIDNTYSKIDSFLGELIESLDKNTTLLVMSDHGFGRKHAATGQLNQWLESRRHLTCRKPGGGSRGLLGRLHKTAVGLTSRRMKERLWNAFPSLRDNVQSRLCFANIDWKGTRAYSDSLFANVRVNLKGRERDGVVNPGAEYDSLVAHLVGGLAGLRDSKSGEKIVSDVLLGEAIYEGPHRGKAPDILIRWREDIVISGIAIENRDRLRSPATPPIPGEDHRIISGDHHLHGVFLARGPDLRNGVEIDGAGIIDLAPTILHGLDLPVPDDMDGRVLEAIFLPGFSAAGKVRLEKTAFRDDRRREGNSAGIDAYGTDEKAEIRKRLKSLGYVE
jgi:predicted AlkP superfamily phosphohydrolase/phosphomutase